MKKNFDSPNPTVTLTVNAESYRRHYKEQDGTIKAMANILRTDAMLALDSIDWRAIARKIIHQKSSAINRNMVDHYSYEGMAIHDAIDQLEDAISTQRARLMDAELKDKRDLAAQLRGLLQQLEQRVSELNAQYMNTLEPF